MALSIQRASTSSHLASPKYDIDVFLSFRGDTRKTFTSHLREALERKRIIKVFMDDRQLEAGSIIHEKLHTVIKNSWFAIIVFSQDYASSRWCLDELVWILESMKERGTIIPIFYNVDPRDVRRQTGTFGDGFNRLVRDGRYAEKLQGWKTALTTVGGISGKDLSVHQLEAEFIKGIVDFLYNKLVCAGCNRRVAEGRNWLGAVWHQACLRCKDCKDPISDQEIQECGDQPYHKQCYERMCLVCNVCKKSIQHIDNREYPFWRGRYCSSHVEDDTPWCCSCERFRPRDTTYYKLEDGRKLCPDCKESIVTTQNGRQRLPLWFEVQKFYKKLNVEVQKIPVRFVSKQDITNVTAEASNGSDLQSMVIRAVCLFEERTVNNAIMGRPSKICSEVKEILIWYGLPRILTGSLIAQQMMRAWLRLNCSAKLSPEVETGISRYFVLMWLDHSSYLETRSAFENKLCKFRKLKIESHCDALAKAKMSVREHGLRMTLKTIRRTGEFPPLTHAVE